MVKYIPPRYIIIAIVSTRSKIAGFTLKEKTVKGLNIKLY